MPNSPLKKIAEHLGATGQYPHGSTGPNDLGELRAAVAIKDGRVVIDFGKMVRWVSMTPEEALIIAGVLTDKARKVQGG